MSLGFAIVQFIGLSYLLCRNQYIDKYWVLLLSPIAIQEFCQFIIWKYGITNATTIHECNNINHICLRIITGVILLLPLFTSYFVLDTINYSTKKWIQIYWKYLLFFGAVLYLILLTLYLTEKDFCISVGPNGHLDWFQTTRSDLPNFIPDEFYIFFAWFFYMMPIISC